jgi:hypothetical protein
MKRPGAQSRTFNQILTRLAAQNAKRLLEKARAANRLAKSAPDGRARRRAYRVKVAALLDLRRHFPARTSVTTDPRIPSFVIVEYASPHTGVRSGLHAPARDFAC